MTDADSILAALEPEDEPLLQWFDPAKTLVIEVSAGNDRMLEDFDVRLGSPSAYNTTKRYPFVPQLSFDDVWGAAFDQVPNMNQTIQRTIDSQDNATDPHDELLNLLSKLRD